MYVTLDFETYYETKKPTGLEEDRPRYSLTNMSYEEYFYSKLFKIQGVGVKVNDEPTEYFPHIKDHPDGFGGIKTAIEIYFPPGNENTLICQNTMFDGPIITWLMGLKPFKYQDTKLMSQALVPFGSHGLKAIAYRLWPDDENMRKGEELISTANKMDLTEEEQKILGGYCIQDVDLTWAAYKRMWPDMPEEELELIDWHIRQFCEPMFMLNRDRLSAHMNLEAVNRKDIIAASGHDEKTLSSNPKFAALVEKLTGEPCPLKESPTNPDKDTYALAAADVAFVDLQLKYPEHKKVWEGRKAAKSTIEIKRAERLIAHRQPNGTIALPLNYYAAHTGRSGGANKVNAQNFKRGSTIRKCITAPKGYVVMVGDLSNIESRLLAWFAEEHYKLDLFRAGGDVYNDLGAEIYGRPIDRKGADVMEGHVSKAAELGLGYNMGAKTYQRTLYVGSLGPQVIIDDAEAQRVVSIYRKKNSNISQSWKTADQYIQHMATRDAKPQSWRCLEVGHRYTRLPNGMYLQYPKLGTIDPEDDIGTSGFSYWARSYYKSLYGGRYVENIIQALGRIVIMTALRKVDAWSRDEFGTGVGLQVHDELVGLVPEAHAEAAKQMYNDILVTPLDWMDDSLTLKADVDYDYEYSK